MNCFTRKATSKKSTRLCCIVRSTFRLQNIENFHEFVESSEHILRVLMMKFVGFVNGHDHCECTNDHKKVHKYAGPFTHTLLGLRTQHLTRFSGWEGPVWA